MNTIIKPNIQGIRAYEFQLFSTKQTWFKEIVIKVLSIIKNIFCLAFVMLQGHAFKT